MNAQDAETLKALEAIESGTAAPAVVAPVDNATGCPRASTCADLASAVREVAQEMQEWVYTSPAMTSEDDSWDCVRGWHARLSVLLSGSNNR